MNMSYFFGYFNNRVTKYEDKEMYNNWFTAFTCVTSAQWLQKQQLTVYKMHFILVNNCIKKNYHQSMTS